MARNSKGRGSSKRGFAAMDKETQRRIASKGGKASHGGRGRSGNSSSSQPSGLSSWIS